MLTETEVHGIIDNLAFDDAFAEFRKNKTHYANYQVFEEEFLYDYTTYSGTQKQAYKQRLKTFVSKSWANVVPAPYTNNPNPTTSMQQIPPKFIEGLKKQVLEQYQKILRYRELRNDEQDEKLRQKYQNEIILRQKNIREVEEEFLNTFSAQPKDAHRIAQEAITQVYAEASLGAEQLQRIEEKINFLTTQHHEGVMSLANLVIDTIDAQMDGKGELTEILAIVQEMKKADSAEVKLKMAIPLLNLLGLGVEFEKSLNPAMKALWEGKK